MRLTPQFRETARVWTLALLLFPGTFVFAQVNSWLKPTSGDWHEAQWSLGSSPGPGQSVFITNAGWKAVGITPSTVQANPQSLTVQSLTIASPVDSRNVLLLNYAGFGVPLTTRFGRIESNAAISILGSVLHLNGGGGEGMSIGGEVTQDAGSLVTGQQLDLGYIGPGVYNLNSGTLGLSNVWIGGSFGGVFNQTGGSNAVRVIHLDPTGTYNLQGGDFNAEVYFEDWYPDIALFRQTGGAVHRAFTMHRGRYLLEGGVNYAGAVVPIYAWGDGYSDVIQTGGTNFGPLDIGFNGTGTYTLSNGVSFGAIRLGGRGHFIQWGGSQNLSSNLSLLGEWIGRNHWGVGWYTLNGGTIFCGGMGGEGGYTQEGGTNIVNGDVLVQQSISPGVRFRMNGGLLRANSLTAFLGVVVAGGRVVLANDLAIHGQGLAQPWYGPELTIAGGQLVVSNILLRGTMALTPGVIQQSGTFTLRTGRMMPATGSHLLGPLILESNGAQLDSLVALPLGNPCLLGFGDSSALAWMGDARLIITNWAGSLAGGGTHQIYIGSDSTGLTVQQLSQIQFHNPVGLEAGTYLAKALPTGEIVPEALPPTGREPPIVQLARQPDGAMRVTVIGDSGSDYGIDVSSNLLTWEFWTNQIATGGSMSVVDTTATNQSAKFYRAVLR